MQKLKYETREEIKRQIKTGDYNAISSLTKGRYKPDTIRLQINGHRTLKKTVIEASNKLFEYREKFLTI